MKKLMLIISLVVIVNCTNLNKYKRYSNIIDRNCANDYDEKEEILLHNEKMILNKYYKNGQPYGKWELKSIKTDNIQQEDCYVGEKIKYMYLRTPDDRGLSEYYIGDSEEIIYFNEKEQLVSKKIVDLKNGIIRTTYYDKNNKVKEIIEKKGIMLDGNLSPLKRDFK